MLYKQLMITLVLIVQRMITGKHYNSIFLLNQKVGERASLLIPKSPVAVIPKEPRSAPVLSLRFAGF